MRYKPNQRVAYYEVTGKSDPCPARIEVGEILIDRPRGKTTVWDFFNSRTEEPAWVTGELLGYARVDPGTMKPVPEPKLQAVLERRKSLGEEA
ncbi:hypothetical protein [Mycetocola reblochoni]|uniref:hypothetical protein n=1 Tax=Mycetocola reblochoni TaxID=331618 RepID=UPI001180A8AB|nr:hypothetical protein [Mycetocola reblochoni]